ncbi:MAG: glycosyltransferase [Oscillospiraceae bacterium]
MRYDIVLVTYNSINWLNGCVKAIANAKYDLARLNLIFVDNASCDDTVNMLHQLKLEHSGFGGFEIIQNRTNKGFGAACNLGADSGKSPFIFFLNTDTEVYPDLFCMLDDAMAAHAAAAYECRQLPFETGHHIDPVTLCTSWASGAALVVKRELFTAISGFDENLFMYCEDVDLSWRIRATGADIVYVPTARVTHYSYQNDGPKLSEYAGSFYGNLLLRYKYGGCKEILSGEKMYLGAIKRPLHFDNVRKVLCKNYLKHFVTLWPFLLYRLCHRNVLKAQTWHFENGFDADRGLAKLEPFTHKPLVSIIVRTYDKKDYLRLALISLSHQTYQNIEIIIAEDGADTCSEMVSNEFSQLNIKYINNDVRKGRAANGNAGLDAAQGEYCMFLDDDDLLYPDHVELFAAKAAENPCADMVLGSAMAMLVEVGENSPYPYKIAALQSMVFSRIDIFNMCQSCRIPIQTVLFKRELYTKFGGMREDLNAHEDWAMWLKYLAHGKRINKSAPDITRITSLFLQPASPEAAAKRLALYKADDNAFYSDNSLRFDVSLADMREYYKGVMSDFEHLYHEGKLEEYFSEAKDKYE